MMSYGISTDTSTFSSWYFFILAALVASIFGVLLARDSGPAIVILLSLIIFTGVLVGLGLYRTLWPLVSANFSEKTQMIGSRTRAAVDREKTLVLRSIKELEFDRAMGKVSEKDFQEMVSRLRARAINLLKQLEMETLDYRDLIDRELEERLAPVAAPDQVPKQAKPHSCVDCGTYNDSDARFCKNCGNVLSQSSSGEGA